MRNSKQILKLIETDIINHKLINSFNAMGIDASKYSTDMSTMIFKLMGINKALRTDELYGKYFLILKVNKKIDIDSKEEVRALAIKIYTRFLKYC